MRQLRLYSRRWGWLGVMITASLTLVLTLAMALAMALVPVAEATSKGPGEGAGGPQLLQAMPGRPAAIDFTLPDLDGKTHQLRDYRGQVVVLNFWATWCPPCRHEIPSMQRAFDALKADKVVVVAVHVGGSEDKVWDFFTDYEVSFPVLMDKASKVTKAWQVQGLPMTFVIDPAGRIAYRAIGGRDWDAPAILNMLRQLAQAGAGRDGN